MLYQQSLTDFISLATQAKKAAVCREILANNISVIQIAKNLFSELANGAILESAALSANNGRYSFIAFHPMAQLCIKRDCVIDPFQILRQLLREYTCAIPPYAADLIGGAIGFISYDAVRLMENIADRHLSNSTLPTILFKLYRTTLVFDHLKQTLLLSTIVDLSKNLEKDYQDGQAIIDQLLEKIFIANIHPKNLARKEKNLIIKTDIDDANFIKMIQVAKKYLQQGDIFQVVLSRCFKRQYSSDPIDIYSSLRQISPAPYMFYLPVNNEVIVGASPEKFISVQDGLVSINPIAGTRKHTTINNFLAIEQDLLTNEKERAEHMMLVDLARNDLGKVCQAGSVQIEKLLQVKHFSHVSHIVSIVTGELKKNKDIFDALVAAFPAGTVSGAPKIRAMQIIDELETSKRHLYGGIICRITSRGNFDSCIALRMAHLQAGTATIRAGAGIVSDSDPQAEADETRSKAQGLLDAIAFAEGERQ